ncbi:MAG: PRC-barrel domain-containing protein [Halobacteriota archaeon]
MVKDILNKPIVSQSGRDFGILKDVMFEEGRKEGLLVAEDESTGTVSIIPSSLVKSAADVLQISDSGPIRSGNETERKTIRAEGLLNKSVVSLSGCDVGRVENFSIDEDSKEVGLVVRVGLQAFHLEITIPWNKVEAINDQIEVSDAAVLHLCLAPLF